MSFELAADGDALLFRISHGASDGDGWCQVFLRGRGSVRALGAERWTHLVRRISTALGEEPAELRWMLSLNERHCSLYGESRKEGAVIQVQDADAVGLGKIVLSPTERSRWLQQLAVWQGR